MGEPVADLSVMSGGDASGLEWYFGPGQAAFERSTFGAILDKIAHDGWVSTECPRCAGRGIMEPDTMALLESTKCTPCKGPGDRQKNIAACEFCWLGTGEVRAGCWCRVCRGVGSKPVRLKHSRSPLTARPTAEVKEPGGYMPPDWALTRYASISRRLGSVPDFSVEVLAAYHGDAGSRWGNTRHGRIFAVYSLTPAGHKLLRMATARTVADFGLSPVERLGTEAEAEKTQPKPNRGALFLSARKQATEYYERAVEHWNSTR